MKCLIDARADVNARDRENKTALDYIMAMNEDKNIKAIKKTLKKAGATVSPT